MSNYGNPPSDPHGQPGGSGQDPYPQPNPYGQPNPYAETGAPGGYGVPGVPPGVTFAHWGKRVVSYLVDAFLMTIPIIPGYVMLGIAAGSATTEYDATTGQFETSGGSGTGLAMALLLLGTLISLGLFIWNICIKQGNTGYSIGKGLMGIKLVKADDGQPIGALMAFVRQIAHILDSLPCYLGYLWPLWDAKRQTFADKVLSTYVIDQPKG